MESKKHNLLRASALKTKPPEPDNSRNAKKVCLISAPKAALPVKPVVDLTKPQGVYKKAFNDLLK